MGVGSQFAVDLLPINLLTQFFCQSESDNSQDGSDTTYSTINEDLCSDPQCARNECRIHPLVKFFLYQSVHFLPIYFAPSPGLNVDLTG